MSELSAEERFAQNYDERVVPAWSVPVASAILDMVRGLELGASPSTLVAECRTGYLINGLVDSLPDAARLMAVDPSSEMLDRARARLKSSQRRIFYSSQDKTSLSYADGVFHLVTCDSGLLTRSDLKLSGKELIRVLRPEGFLALALPLRHTFSAFADMFREAIYRHAMRDLEAGLDNFLAALITRDEIEPLLAEAGLELVDSRFVDLDLPFSSGEDFLFSPFVENLFLPRWLTLCQDDEQREPLFFDLVESINIYFEGLPFHAYASIACVIAQRME